MQGRSQTWQTLVNAGNYTVIPHLTISGSLTYGTETIVEMKSSIKVLGSGGSYDIPNAGNCISAQLDVTLKGTSDTIPRMAKLEPYIDLTNGTTTTTDHLKKGVFYIDTRKLNSAGSTVYDYDTLVISAYDAMMLTELSYYALDGDIGTWPKTDISVVNEIAARIGVEVDSTVSSIMNKSYPVQYPGYGESGLTLRETLGTIGAMYAGNWIISDDGKLKLIQIKAKNSSDQTITKYGNIDISEANAAYTRVIINVDSDTYYTYPGATLSYSNWQASTAYSVGDPVVYNSSYYICRVAHTSGSTFDSSKWDKDIVFVLDCQWASSEVSGAAIGYQMAQNIYNIVSGYSYRGFKLEEAIFDPALEVGDRITVGSANVYVFNRDMIFDYLLTADLEAPIESEIDHEFQYQLGSGSTVQRSLASVKTSLTVQSGQIEGLISGQITTYRSATNPYAAFGVTRHTGDLWYCTADTTSGGISYSANTWYRWSGSVWDETTANVDVAPDWEEDTSYSVGDVVTYNGHWYKCTTAHTSGSSWDSSKWEVCDTISEVSQSQILQQIDSIQLGVAHGANGSYIYLTANGITQKTSGQMYFDTDNAHFTGKLSAVKVVARGDDFLVTNADETIIYGKVGYGSGNDGHSDTNGVILQAYTYDPNSGQYVVDTDHYFIVTDQGVRMSSGDYSIFVTNNGCYTKRSGASAVQIGTAVWGS